ncbi:hypothetical protein J4217_02390 [Candidatus Pacearchaeota archaeon]|nr:hypothetical protein [Candidatus Pacearchaeota archaeon]
MQDSRNIIAEIEEKVDKRISERTGLKTREEIDAYARFCHHSDLRNGVIMCGDVQYEFYINLFEQASEPMKKLERAYNDAIGNECLTERAERSARSPLSATAKKRFQYFYHKFMELDLIAPPAVIGICVDYYYPALKGYNYLKDPEFYDVEITDTCTSVKLRG